MQKAAGFGQVLLGNAKAKHKQCGYSRPPRPPGSHGFIGIVSLTFSLEREGQCGSEKLFLFLIKESVTSTDHSKINRLSSVIHKTMLLGETETLF